MLMWFKTHPVGKGTADIYRMTQPVENDIAEFHWKTQPVSYDQMSYRG